MTDRGQEQSRFEAGSGDQPSGERNPRQPKPARTRRDWPDVFGVFYVTDDETHCHIEAFFGSLRRAYGLPDARAILRAACMAAGTRGTRVLAWLQANFGHRDPYRPDWLAQREPVHPDLATQPTALSALAWDDLLGHFTVIGPTPR